MRRTTLFVAALFCLVTPAEAQRSGRSTPAVAAGALAGGAVGFVAGALIGGSITSRDCEPGNPDQCLGAAFPGFIWGAGAGMTIGIPVGAHITNRRSGNFARTFGVSALIFGAEVLALDALVDDGRTRNKGLTFGIAAIAPVVQLIASVAVERSTSP